jgi:ataxia telangiectasia mutated family protein
MLVKDLVPYKDIAEDVDVMVSATEISAPLMICDTSLSLMMHLLHIRNTEVPGGSLIASHHVLRWLSTRWNPGKSW